MRSNVQNGLRL